MPEELIAVGVANGVSDKALFWKLWELSETPGEIPGWIFFGDDEWEDMNDCTLLI